MKYSEGAEVAQWGDAAILSDAPACVASRRAGFCDAESTRQQNPGQSAGPEEGHWKG